MAMHKSRHRASAVWNGPVGGGTGTMRLGLKGPEVGYTVDARMTEEGGTNPEQMLGAAHAGCFAMALTSLIEDAGVDASAVSIDAKAVVQLEQKDDGFWITRIDLTARGTVPGMDEADFVALAERAKATCPVSKLFAGAEIGLDAALA